MSIADLLAQGYAAVLYLDSDAFWKETSTDVERGLLSGSCGQAGGGPFVQPPIQTPGRMHVTPYALGRGIGHSEQLLAVGSQKRPQR